MKVVTINKLPVSIGGGPRYYATTTAGGPKGFAVNFIVTLLFPNSMA